ncbi:DNA ligase k alpha [Novymonas esmeraldas]|uniref:DNA ligase k alpha n=1 Tax=Novymonas esmeraldas TaxID=1808958 RepID=A0AAW0EKW7_9TRYP
MKISTLWRCSGGRGAGVGRPTLLLRLRATKRAAAVVAAKARGSTATVTAKKKLAAAAAATAVIASSGRGGAHKKLSLAEYHPAIARTWIAAASNKMLQPQHVMPDSRKLAWWLCPACHHQHNKRIDLHLAAGGACPQCMAKPTANASAARRRTATVGSDTAAAAPPATTGTEAQTAPLSGAPPVFHHRCRPDSARGTITADNANRLCKSVADDQYLRVQETRNLLPMLAKSYDKECRKIAAGEVLRVSPKLDGIRCVAAYRVDTKQVLFFSRSGTLFECCDDAIEPALRCLFEKDPTLVLDGELYNDSVNQTQLHSVRAASSSSSSSPTAAAAADPCAAFYHELVAAMPPQRRRKAAASDEAPVVIRFERLTSAIRTTRQRRTPEVAALQRQLQYHVFDVLYSRELPHGRGSAVPFSVRYAVLEKLLATATTYNTAHISGYNPMVLRRVPSYLCTAAAVDAVLHAAMRVGYEGIMIRREGRGATPVKDVAPVRSAKAKIKRGAAGNDDGGYGYGQRSGTLLKYKVMQDAEYMIVGAVEGAGKWKGSLGAFICVTPDTKHRFTVTPASTDVDKRRMWRTWRAAYKGKALTVQYQEITPDGVPRFPVGKCVRGAADGHDWV